MRLASFLLFFFALQIAKAQNAPIARADTFYVCPGDTFVLYPLANDNAPNGDTLHLDNFITPPPVINPPSGTFNRQGDSVIFVAVQNFSNSATGGYRVCNAQGQCSFSTYTLMLDQYCNGVKQNRAPIANPDIMFAIEDLSFSVRPLQNDRDPDGDPLTWHPITQPLNGTLTQSGNNYSYKGDLNYNGFDGFLYRACDTAGKCATSVVVIYVAPVNDPPVAVNDTFTILEDQVLNGNVLNNDYDVDGDKLKASMVQQPFNGKVTLNQDGSFVYTPDKDYYGRDEFKYKACDTARFLNCAQARVLINIQPVNDAPEVDSIIIFTDNKGGIFTEDVSTKAKDVENDTMHYHIVSTASNSAISATIDSVSGLLKVNVARGFCGKDSFLINVCDYELCTPVHVYVIAPDCVDEIDLVEGFSPNGDGKNDNLYFKGLEQFAPVNLVVFNRNGYPVYENEDYQNDWEGLAPNNQPLPDGTYYYILETTLKNKRYKNFLVIHR
ncbi:MAG: Ig-like domain-containing protein [Chitinophagales bacterium]|nr:tandem-95 repeat protein [Chitinophagales bacterium]MCO5279639.1 Ig-like domain-containing protein [Chitinophagales bacterium]HRP39842.1 Ig-like domain-containing protein [Chitinophagales bacterium]